MHPRLEKIKTHVQDNAIVYTACASAIVGGAVVYFLVREDKTSIRTEIHGNENVVTNIVVNLQRRMHPGYKVVCNETGEVFASINRTAEVMGLNPRRISEHMKGKLSDVNGHTFTNLGEMV